MQLSLVDGVLFSIVLDYSSIIDLTVEAIK